MKKEQLISLWVFAGLWGLTVLFGFLSFDFLGFNEFFQISLFWGVFAVLTHITIGKGKITNSDKSAIKIKINIYLFSFYIFIGGLFTSLAFHIRNERFTDYLSIPLGVLFGFALGALSYLIFEKCLKKRKKCADNNTNAVTTTNKWELMFFGNPKWNPYYMLSLSFFLAIYAIFIKYKFYSDGFVNELCFFIADFFFVIIIMFFYRFLSKKKITKEKFISCFSIFCIFRYVGIIFAIFEFYVF